MGKFLQHIRFLTVLEVIVCFGKGMCNTRKLQRKAILGIFCSEISSLPYFCHDDELTSDVSW